MIHVYCVVVIITILCVQIRDKETLQLQLDIRMTDEQEIQIANNIIQQRQKEGYRAD